MTPVEEAENVAKKRKALDILAPDPDAFAALAPLSPVIKKGRVRSEGMSSLLRVYE
jgi:hypothetical protein